jgi:hypothetical protein
MSFPGRNCSGMKGHNVHDERVRRNCRMARLFVNYCWERHRELYRLTLNWAWTEENAGIGIHIVHQSKNFFNFGNGVLLVVLLLLLSMFIPRDVNFSSLLEDCKCWNDFGSMITSSNIRTREGKNQEWKFITHAAWTNCVQTFLLNDWEWAKFIDILSQLFNNVTYYRFDKVAFTFSEGKIHLFIQEEPFRRR